MVVYFMLVRCSLSLVREIRYGLQTHSMIFSLIVVHYIYCLVHGICYDLAAQTWPISVKAQISGSSSLRVGFATNGSRFYVDELSQRTWSAGRLSYLITDTKIIKALELNALTWHLEVGS